MITFELPTSPKPTEYIGVAVGQKFPAPYSKQEGICIELTPSGCIDMFVQMPNPTYQEIEALKYGFKSYSFYEASPSITGMATIGTWIFKFPTPIGYADAPFHAGLYNDERGKNFLNLETNMFMTYILDGPIVRIIRTSGMEHKAISLFKETVAKQLQEKISPLEYTQSIDRMYAFPCQPFSIAGTRNGFRHTQGTLFFDIERILRVKKPKVVLLENVKHLVNHDEGRTFGVVCNSLKNLGYHIQYQVLNATTHGDLPQNRERVYIVSFLDKEMTRKFRFPDEIAPAAKLFGGIIDVSDRKADKHYMTDMSSPAVQRMHAGITKKGVVYQSRRTLIRDNKSGVCPTLTANMGTGGHNVPLIHDDFGIRKLTPRECFNLQGFPADFKFPHGMADSHLYKQAGNSIPVPVVERIAEKIVNVIADASTKSTLVRAQKQTSSIQAPSSLLYAYSDGAAYWKKAA